MSLFFPSEIATHVTVHEGYILIEQYDDKTLDLVATVKLTEHQFMEIYNREKHILGLLREDREKGSSK